MLLFSLQWYTVYESGKEGVYIEYNRGTLPNMPHV